MRARVKTVVMAMKRGAVRFLGIGNSNADLEMR